MDQDEKCAFDSMYGILVKIPDQITQMRSQELTDIQASLNRIGSRCLLSRLHIDLAAAAA
jgi:hypothetical protein